MGKKNQTPPAGEATAADDLKTIAMVRAGDTGTNAVVANVKPEDVAAAKRDGWIEQEPQA